MCSVKTLVSKQGHILNPETLKQHPCECTFQEKFTIDQIHEMFFSHLNNQIALQNRDLCLDHF